MSENKTRRQFLKWAGPAGSLLLLQLGCGGPGGTTVRGRDVGRDGGTTGTGPDIASDGGTGSGRDAASATDTGAPTDAGTGDVSNPDTGADAGADPDVSAEDAGACEATGSDVEGPFHLDGAPSRSRLAGMNEPGERIVVEGTVYGPDCMTPLSGVLLDVWHADDTGAYDDSTTDYRLRGQLQTDAMGRYRLETIKPGRYPLGGSTRPAHIHFIVSKPGYAPLTTQMYFEGDPFLSPNDPCGAGCNSGDPTLIVPFEDGPDGAMVGTFDIVLTRP